jgi:hypothetical protein
VQTALTLVHVSTSWLREVGSRNVVMKERTLSPRDCRWEPYSSSMVGGVELREAECLVAKKGGAQATTCQETTIPCEEILELHSLRTLFA